MVQKQPSVVRRDFDSPILETLEFLQFLRDLKGKMAMILEENVQFLLK